MALNFNIDGVIVDKVLWGIAENSAGDILYTLSQLTDVSVETSAETKDATDRDGVLIKRFYTSKSGTVNMTNAYVSLNILATGAGTDKEVATAEAPIVMPQFKTAKVGTKTIELKDVVEGSIKVVGLTARGTKIADYTKDTAASATAYSIAEGVVTLPTDENVGQFLISYERNVTSGVKVVNKADAFPKQVKLSLVVACVEECQPDVERIMVIEFPAFQPSPETTLTLSTDGNMDFNGDLISNACSADKELYTVYFADED
jgi:hypothetical protein